LGRLDYLKQYESVNTVRTYKIALMGFFKTIYNVEEPLADLAEKYFAGKRDYEEDMRNFLASVKKMAPKTVKQRLSAVRVFLLENDVELPQKFWRRLRGRVRGNRALTLDKVPNNLQLRRIMMHLPIQGKSLFLCLASSGMRIGEALQLRLGDLDLDADPARVNIRGEYTKSGNSRVTFISKESSEVVEEWLKVREEYLESASARSRYDKSTEDPRLWPFSAVNARHVWNIGLSKTGNGGRDQMTRIRQMHPHTLRKFFRTKLGAVIPVDVVEALMGHEGYLTEVYRRYTMEDLARFYKQGEPALLVFTEAEEVGKLRAEVEDRNKQLQTRVNGLTAENLELKTRFSRMELEHVEFKKKIETNLKQLRKQLEELSS